ncbi:MAG: hypothetical protein CL947_02980 [Epsilonproteobacteria bacterium]|nr:hypothetical protein [Campylobacterota bacterium]|tara:strand:- start:5427 stop:5804 length:378 start_codon:yes stop_codon:yes gene_type:complete
MNIIKTLSYILLSVPVFLLPSFREQENSKYNKNAALVILEARKDKEFIVADNLEKSYLGNDSSEYIRSIEEQSKKLVFAQRISIGELKEFQNNKKLTSQTLSFIQRLITKVETFAANAHRTGSYY